MITNNKLDKTFGTAGAFAGLVLLIFGIYTCFYSWIGVTTIVVGLFLAFTHTSTKIDYENKKARFSNNLFGIISVGFWSDIVPDMSLEVHKTVKSSIRFSMSNTKNAEIFKDYRIMLINKSGIVIMALQKFELKEDAEKALEKMIKKLNISIKK